MYLYEFNSEIIVTRIKKIYDTIQSPRACVRMFCFWFFFVCFFVCFMYLFFLQKTPWTASILHGTCGRRVRQIQCRHPWIPYQGKEKFGPTQRKQRMQKQNVLHQVLCYKRTRHCSTISFFLFH